MNLGPDGNQAFAAREIAAQLPKLVLAAKRAARNVALGLHGRRQSGFGEQFWQFRMAQSGDQLTDIDWRQSARSPHLYVRESEKSVSQTLMIWIDQSPSMNWHSAPTLPTKLWQAQVLGLALAELALKAGERVAIGAHPPRLGANMLERLAHDLLTLPHLPLAHLPLAQLPLAQSHIPTGSENVAPLVVISDFWDVDLAPLNAHQGPKYLVQILDPAEEDFPYQGRIRFKGLEGEGHHLVRRADDLKAAYHQALTLFRYELAGLARQMAATLATHRTDHGLMPCLLALHQRMGLRA